MLEPAGPEIVDDDENREAYVEQEAWHGLVVQLGLHGTALPEWVRRDVSERGELTALIQGELTAEEVAERVRQRMSSVRYFVPARPEGAAMLSDDWAATKPSTLRDEAISRLVAAEAAEDLDVQAFRSRYLPNGKVKWADVEGTLKDFEAQTTGSPYVGQISVPAEYISAAGVVGAAPIEISTDKPHDKIKVDNIETRTLAYAGPGDLKLSTINVGTEGPLAELRALVRVLCANYGWFEAQAVIWLLTDFPPLISGIAIEDGTVAKYPALQRVKLLIDPTLSPREVNDVYRRIREEAVGRRHRELSEKHVALALFSIAKDGRSTTERMADWNEQYPDWQYKNVSHFGWDTRAARRQLLGQPPEPINRTRGTKKSTSGKGS